MSQQQDDEIMNELKYSDMQLEDQPAPNQQTGMINRLRQRGKQMIDDALITGDAVMVGVKQAGVKVIGGVK